MPEDRYAHGLLKWEERFQALGDDGWAFGAGPAPEVAQAVSFYRQRVAPTGGRAIDLGAGDGRNTLYLAAQGFEVLAVEAAPTGAQRITERLAAQGLTAEVVTADLRAYQLPADLDLLISAHVIHLLPGPYQRLHEWQAATRSGGICLVSSRGPFAADPPGYYWYPEPGEFKHCFQFAGWQILAASDEERLMGETLSFHTGVIAQKRGTDI